VFGESLGTTVERILAGVHIRPDAVPLRTVASFAETSEYADVGAQVLETAALVMPARRNLLRKLTRRARDWVRRQYGLRELVLPEKYRVDTRNAVVVTYSSCLAQVYFADDPRALQRADIQQDSRRAQLYAALLAHPGIGLIAVRAGTTVHLESRVGRAILARGTLDVISGSNPLELYGTDTVTLQAIADLVHQPQGGDLVLFGAYDGYDIVSFDDQIGAHGAVGGDQALPFIIAPAALNLDRERLDNARDIHRAVMLRYAAPSPPVVPEPPGTAGAAPATDRKTSPLSSAGSATAAERR
jgi:hypothetical protein